MTGCIHHEDMGEYNDDAAVNDKPWLLWECCPLNGTWFDLTGHPGWHPDSKYRRKQQTQKIGAFDVPLPYRGELKANRACYIANPMSVSYSTSVNSAWGQVLNIQRRNLLHLTEESAAIHGKALASLMGESNE